MAKENSIKIQRELRTKMAGLRVVEDGAGRVADSTPRPHMPAQIDRDKQRGAKQTAQPRAPAWGNKASDL